MWVEEVNMMLSERNFEIRNDATKGKIITRNSTLMDKTLKCLKIKKLENKIINQINHVMLRKICI